MQCQFTFRLSDPNVMFDRLEVYELKGGDQEDTGPHRVICTSQLVARSQFGNIVKILVQNVDMARWGQRKFHIHLDRVGYAQLSGDEILTLSGKSSITR